MENKHEKIAQAIVDLLVQNNLSLGEAQLILGTLYRDIPNYTVLTSSRQEP